MPIAVSEAIAIVIETRLRELIEGQELTNVVDVIRPTVYGGFTPEDNQIVITQGSTSEVPELSYPGNPPATCWETTYNIRCRILPSESDDVTKSNLSSQFMADVIKAITTPAATWHNFDGYSINARLESIENNNSEVFEGVLIPLVVQYRTNENDPYTVRA